MSRPVAILLTHLKLELRTRAEVQDLYSRPIATRQEPAAVILRAA